MAQNYSSMKKSELLEKIAELERERDLAQKYLEIAGVMIVAIDVNGVVTMINRHGSRILGQPEKDIVGREWFDFVPERNRRVVRAAFRQIIAGDVEPVEYFENPVVDVHGLERIILWHNTVTRDVSGNITGTLSSGQDITERKQMLEVIKASESVWRLYFENISDVIFSYSTDMILLNVSPSVERALGYPPEELEGRPIEELGLLSPKYLELAMANAARIFAGEKLPPTEYEIIAADGSVRLFELVSTPIYFEGEIDSVVVIARDVSNRGS